MLYLNVVYTPTYGSYRPFPADHYLRWLRGAPTGADCYCALVYDETDKITYGVTWRNTMEPLHFAPAPTDGKEATT